MLACLSPHQPLHTTSTPVPNSETLDDGRIRLLMIENLEISDQSRSSLRADSK